MPRHNGGMNKQIQIFKAGKHTAMSGVALSFSDVDIAATVAAYDPSKHEAPLVIGHPKTDDPAFGWVKSLQFADGVLQAEPDQVDAAFAELVNDGKFKKISASFYTPDAPNNPVPGVYYLRHVGFLGAQAPAVKGLKAASFSDAEEGVVEFTDWDQFTVASMFRRLREWIISTSGIEAADKVIPSYEIESLQINAAQEENTPLAYYSESNNQSIGDEMSAEDKAKMEKLEAENAAFKKQQADFAETQEKTRRDAAHADNVAFAEGLAKSGQLLPAQKDAVIATLDALTSPAQALEFGEGEAKKPLAAALKEALSSNPKLVEFGEHTGGEEPANIIDDADAIAEKAVEFAEAEAKAGRTVNAAQAVAHVVSKLTK